MIRLLSAIVALTTFSASCSACWFPFFPTYSSGYYGWGNPSAGCGYSGYGARYPGYGYGGYSPGYYGGSYGGGCANGACGATYSASYVGYQSGCNTCGVSSCCGTCNPCGASCLPTDSTLSRPTPDPVNDRDFRSGTDFDDNRDLNDRTRRDDLSDRNRNLPGDRSSRPGAGDFDRDPEWRRNPSTFGEDDDLGGGFDREINSGIDGGARKVPMDDGDRTFGAEGEESPDVIDREANKPPISDPLEEGSSGSQPADNTAAPEAEQDDDNSDVLPPEPPTAVSARSRMIFVSDRSVRSRLHDVITPIRTTRRLSPVKSTVISSETSKTRAPRWISVPMPAGQVRL